MFREDRILTEQEVKAQTNDRIKYFDDIKAVDSIVPRDIFYVAWKMGFEYRLRQEKNMMLIDNMPLQSVPARNWHTPMFEKDDQTIFINNIVGDLEDLKLEYNKLLNFLRKNWRNKDA